LLPLPTFLRNPGSVQAAPEDLSLPDDKIHINICAGERLENLLGEVLHLCGQLPEGAGYLALQGSNCIFHELLDLEIETGPLLVDFSDGNLRPDLQVLFKMLQLAECRLVLLDRTLEDLNLHVYTTLENLLLGRTRIGRETCQLFLLLLLLNLIAEQADLAG
jgi:hypothetical protein